MNEKRIWTVTRLLSFGASLCRMPNASQQKPPGDTSRPLLWASVYLAHNVYRLRTNAHINKQTFCLMVGIGRPFLNKIEKGLADPHLSIITKLAEALETTPGALLEPPTKNISPSNEQGKPPHPLRIQFY